MKKLIMIMAVAALATQAYALPGGDKDAKSDARAREAARRALDKAGSSVRGASSADVDRVAKAFDATKVEGLEHKDVANFKNALAKNSELVFAAERMLSDKSHSGITVLTDDGGKTKSAESALNALSGEARARQNLIQLVFVVIPEMETSPGKFTKEQIETANLLLKDVNSQLARGSSYETAMSAGIKETKDEVKAKTGRVIALNEGDDLGKLCFRSLLK
jgi:hypothetical protein